MAEINGTINDDVLNGTDGADTISGLFGNDTIYIGLGADTLNGGLGDDRFLANAIALSSTIPPSGLIDGGDGFDTIDLSAVSSGSLKVSGGTQTLTIGSQNYNILNVEKIVLSSASDYIFSIPAGIELHGGGGADDFSVSGNVKVYGDDGNDEFFVSGSFGSSLISGGIIDGGSGYDTLQTNIQFRVDLSSGLSVSGNTSYTIRNFERVQVTTGESYLSSVFGNESDNTFEINPLFADRDNGSVGVIFDGRGGNDVLNGSNGNDTLTGGTGDDLINGRGGSDLISGGDGNDHFVYSQGSDRIDGGLGTDALVTTNLARAQVVSTTNGSTSVGATIINNVENLNFQDGTLTFDSDSVAAQIYRLYDSAFGREPDYFGGQGWIESVTSGTTLATVSQKFVASEEFQGRTAGMTNSQLVDYIYQFTLRRAPDAEGRANWIGYLDSGRSVADMLVGFSESAEHRNLTASGVQGGLWDGKAAYETVEFMYDAVFGRRPDAGGLINWAGLVESGGTARDLAAKFILSDEYKTNTAGLSNAALVDYTYDTALSRPADPGGRANWIAYLDAGNSIADLITGFATSTELMNANINYIDHGIFLA